MSVCVIPLSWEIQDEVHTSSCCQNEKQLLKKKKKYETEKKRLTQSTQ